MAGPSAGSSAGSSTGSSCAPYVAGLGAENPWTSGWVPIYSELVVKQQAADAGEKFVVVVGGGGMLKVDVSASESSPPARARECGDPAVDGYSHVVPSCLEKSKTAKDFDASQVGTGNMGLGFRVYILGFRV